MGEDAKFEDGAEAPLRLLAVGADDLKIISSLTQDSIFPASEISWQPAQRRFGLLVNRFRWEDREFAEKQARPFERVRTVIVVNSVLKVSSNGIDRNDKDALYSLLSIDFTEGEDAEGRVELTLAGDGAIAFDVECLDVQLKDVTRPYAAPSGHAPSHNLQD